MVEDRRSSACPILLKRDFVSGRLGKQRNADPRPSINGDSTADDAMRAYFLKKVEDPQYDWKQPINFYGKVVDESNHPVVGATVIFGWVDLSPTTYSTTEAKSDESGLFSLLNRTGKGLSVKINKEGYYFSRGEVARHFEYANPADGLHKPDPNNPVIYHLRKRGLGSDLITSQYGIRTDFPISIPRDGTALTVDLMERKAGSLGQIHISQQKPEHVAWKQATNWFFKMEIPDGGFVEHNDEFPFEAPESYYQAIVEFRFDKDDPTWALDLKKSYYIRFGNPPRYGRLQIETGISQGGVILTYAINPSGSRNLEPKENQ